MKKGFTLVELLAVIVILAVILVIAIPQVLKVVDNSRINAYIKNEEMVLRAIDLYVSRNTGSLPGEIGSTTEVSINYLVTNGMLTEIKNPYNKNEDCAGYVTIMKLSDTEYDYTPHLRCGLDINDSSDDSLVLHYKFDDFQEPTENIYTDPLMVNGKLPIHSNAGIYAESYHEQIKTPFGEYATTIEYLSAGGTTNLHHYGVFKTISYSYEGAVTYSSYVKAPKGRSIGIKINRIIDGSVDWSNSMIHFIATGDWQKIHASLPENLIGETTGFSLRVGFNHTNVDVGDRMYIAANQLELRGFPTPFVEGIRKGFIKDHSGNNNHTFLEQQLTTPKWTEYSKVGTGAYRFNKQNTIIYKYNFDQPSANNFTVSAWVYLNSHSSNTNIGQVIVSNYSSYKGWILSLNGTNSRPQIRNHDGSSTSYNLVAQNGLDLNKWYFITATDDGDIVKIYVNGEVINWRNSIPSVEYYDMLRIGAFNNTHAIFDGIIDDVRIYGRALSEEEIRLIYNSAVLDKLCKLKNTVF